MINMKNKGAARNTRIIVKKRSMGNEVSVKRDLE